MRTAIYMEQGEIQIVLTPEDSEEKRILELFDNRKVAETHWGNFYGCQGGYFRTTGDENSLMILLKKE